MIRTFATALLLAGLVSFAQGTPQQFPPGMVPPEHDPKNAGNEVDKCQAVCGEAMQKCMMPCLGGDPQAATKPENRSKTMACVKRCGDQQEPCMSKCDSKKPKKP